MSKDGHFEKLINIIPQSFGEIQYTNRNEGNFIWITVPHDKGVNQRIKADEDIRFYSIITFGYDSLSDNQDIGKIPIQISINFAYYDEPNQSYPLTMPNNVKLIYCPVEIENIIFCYWDKNEGKILNRYNDEVDLLPLIYRFYQKHIKPLKPIQGFFVRAKRFLLWNVLYHIVNFIISLLRLLFIITSGKQLKIKENKMNIYYLMKNQQKLTTEIIDLEIAGTKVHNVDFFGTKINLIPLVFYCLFHLMLYTFYYYTEYELSDYLQQIFQNGFLTTLYVVLTLTLLEYGISKIIKLQLEIWWNVMRRIKNSIVRQYDNNKLQGI